MKFTIYIFLLLALIGCDSKTKKSHLIGTDKLGLKIIDTCTYDTAKYILELNIVEEKNLIGLVDTAICDYYNEKIDTVELEYIHYACYCPNWIRSDSLKSNANCSPNYSGYYLRPACSSLKLPEELDFGTKIKVIGRVSKEMYNLKKFMSGRYSSNDDEPGFEFKYYSYQIIKPYYLLGPSTCRYDKNESRIIYINDKLEIE